MFLRKLIFLAICSSYFSLYGGGFSADTLVKTESGYKKIASIRAGEAIITCDGKQEVVGIVTRVVMHYGSSKRIVLNNEVFITGAQQQFSRKKTNDWQFSADFFAQYSDVHVQDYGSEVLFDLAVEPFHTFYVSKQNILAHNFDGAGAPILILSAAPPIAMIAPWVIPVAAGATALWFIGKEVLKHFNEKQKQSDPVAQVEEVSAVGFGGSPDPEEPDSEKNFFCKLKLRADKVARIRRFGKIYRDPLTDLWWSKDRAGHGGSCYKVYKKTAKGFEWLYDAAQDGSEIVCKHKGPTGMFIANKEVFF